VVRFSKFTKKKKKKKKIYEKFEEFLSKLKIWTINLSESVLIVSLEMYCQT